MTEIESMKLRERVAELRRQLLQGAVVEDYAFIEAPSILVPATPRFDPFISANCSLRLAARRL